MTERRHRAPLDKVNAAMFRHPPGQALPAEFRPPAETARQRREAFLGNRPQTSFGAEMIDENDFTPRPGDADEFIERRLWVRHRGNHILRDHDIECRFGKCEVLRIHDRKTVDIAELAIIDTGFGFAQHWRRQVHAHKPV
jgi:hypothetical protein